MDDLCAVELPDFVTADIEGAEIRMLKGATRILEHGRTVFLLELHTWADPVDGENIPKFMKRWGYYPVSFFKHTLFMPLGMTYLRTKIAAGLRKLMRRR